MVRLSPKQRARKRRRSNDEEDPHARHLLPKRRTKQVATPLKAPSDSDGGSSSDEFDEAAAESAARAIMEGRRVASLSCKRRRVDGNKLLRASSRHCAPQRPLLVFEADAEVARSLPLLTLDDAEAPAAPLSSVLPQTQAGAQAPDAVDEVLARIRAEEDAKKRAEVKRGSTTSKHVPPPLITTSKAPPQSAKPQAILSPHPLQSPQQAPPPDPLVPPQVPPPSAFGPTPTQIVLKSVYHHSADRDDCFSLAALDAMRQAGSGTKRVFAPLCSSMLTLLCPPAVLQNDRRFKNYAPGTPSNVLYVKNLPRKRVSEQLLLRLFGCVFPSAAEASRWECCGCAQDGASRSHSDGPCISQTVACPSG